MSGNLPEPLDVRYGAGHDRAPRDVLLQQWHQTCHLCTRPKLFHEIEIDHLIPRTVDEATLRRLIERYDLSGYRPADDGFAQTVSALAYR